MAHYAKVLNDIVVKVIVAEADFFNTFTDDSPGQWIQTSYNENIRKNYAGIGYTYDRVRDAFIPPKPFPSWILDEEKCFYVPPVTYPSDGQSYYWDENNGNWALRD